MTDKETIGVLKQRIKELERENENLREKEEKILSSAKRLYDFEADRLRLFKSAWNRVYKAEIISGERREKLDALARKIDDVFSSSVPNAEKADRARSLLNDSGEVKGEVVFGEGENAFSLDDILNPKQKIDIQELKKDLGL